MRKVSIALLVLLGLAMCAWIYFANKFEQIAINEILPKIKDNKDIVTADTDSAIIEKYKFTIILKDVTIFPKSSLLKTSADHVAICYLPLSDKIELSLLGGKLKTGTDKTETYTKAEASRAEFSRSLLNHDGTGEVTISSGPSSVHWTKDDSLLSRSKKTYINIKFVLDQDGFYIVEVKDNVDGTEFSSNPEFLKEALEATVPSNNLERDINKMLMKFVEYYTNTQNKIGPINLLAEGSLKLQKKHVDNILSALKGEMDSLEVVKNFSLIEENFILSYKLNCNNSYTSETVTYNFSKEKGKVNLDVDVLLSKNYTDAQKKEIANYTNGLLLEYLNANPRFEPAVTQEDLKVLIDKYLDVKETKLSLNLSGDISSQTFVHNLGLKLDNFSLDSSGSLDGSNYNGDLKLATPKILINTLSDLYNGSIKQILDKLIVKDVIDVNNTNLIVENLKNNGMGFLAAFDKKNALKEDDNFEANIHYNLEKFEFKVNDKGILQLLTDERVVKFLKDMVGTK